VRNTWIWRGFGALLFVGILAGYVPDLMIVSTMRGARAEGLLTLPPSPNPSGKDDARPLYVAAATKYAQAPALLETDYARQIKTPAPHVVKYLDAMAVASERPFCSTVEDNAWDYRGQEEQKITTGSLHSAAKAIVDRATDERGLRAAARIARHLALQESARAPLYTALLGVRALDRAAVLGLDAAARRRVADAFGPPLEPREAFRRRVAYSAVEFERRNKEEGPRVGRTRDEERYLRFWRGFFRTAPTGGSAFVGAVRERAEEIERAESTGRYTDLTPVVGGAPHPWLAWTQRLEAANARLKAGR